MLWRRRLLFTKGLQREIGVRQQATPNRVKGCSNRVKICCAIIPANGRLQSYALFSRLFGGLSIMKTLYSQLTPALPRQAEWLTRLSEGTQTFHFILYRWL